TTRQTARSLPGSGRATATTAPVAPAGRTPARFVRPDRGRSRPASERFRAQRHRDPSTPARPPRAQIADTETRWIECPARSAAEVPPARPPGLRRRRLEPEVPEAGSRETPARMAARERGRVFGKWIRTDSRTVSL